MRKVVTGILSLCMVSSMMAESVMAAPDTVRGDVNGDGVINTKDIVMMKKYLLGEEKDIDTDGADLNGDQKINVVDMLYLTGVLTEDIKMPEDPKNPEEPKESETPKNPEGPKDPAEQKDPEESKAGPEAIAEMNKNAKRIFDTAVNAQLYLDFLHPDRKLDGGFKVLKNDSGTELTELMNQTLGLPDGTLWKVLVRDDEIMGSICASGGVTGAYPNEIPMSVSVDYDKLDDTHPEYYSEVTIDWKEVYPEGVSKDENIKDYVPKTTEDLNQEAKILCTLMTTLDQEAETAGKNLIPTVASDYLGTVADENIDRNTLDKIYRLTYLNPKNTKFSVEMINGEIVGCICTDSYGKVTGAYPNAIPQTMNIPYSASICGQSRDVDFDWKEFYPEYISDDPVQSALPDYPEKSVDEYNSLAKTVFTNAQTILQEKETEGKEVRNGVYTGTSELFDHLADAKVKYYILVKDYEVICTFVSGGEFNRSGAYPYNIPYDMDIPFDEFKEEKYPYSDVRFKPDWKAVFPEYITDVPKLPDRSVQTANDYNSEAVNVFANVQTILQEYETAGKEVPNGIYTSDSELFRELDPYYSELFREFDSDEYEFSVKIENYNVRGAVVGSENGSGAYPVSISPILKVPFDKNLADVASDPEADWFALYPDAVMDFKAFSDEMGGDYLGKYTPVPYFYYWTKKASVNSANANAKSVFTNAQTVAQEFETKGVVVDGIFSSSDTSSEFVNAVKQNLNWNNNLEWSVKIKNNVVVGACASAGKGYTGAYPNYVPSTYIVDYDGYKDLCEEPHKSTEWLSVGYEFAP